MRLSPDRRAEATRKKVALAVLRLIEGGRTDFELQEVAGLAGVHRTTLFRRWPDRESLIGEALSEHVSHFSVEWSGDWKEDLRRIAFAMRDFLMSPVEEAMNRIQAGSKNVEFSAQMLRYWTPIIKSLQKPINAAQDAGEISAEIDSFVLIWSLISPILVTTVFLYAPASDEFLNTLVSQTIRACQR